MLTSQESPSTPVAGTTTRTQPENLIRYPALDGLRAVAFLLVFLQHYYDLPWGFGGVNLFFVLSGFLITGILYDTRDRPDRARAFYIRRTLRIFPLYYGVLLVILLSTAFFHWVWSWPWLAWPLYLGNFLRFWAHGSQTPGNDSIALGHLRSSTSHAALYLGHFWSLCVEEQFYLVWPWVIFSVRSRKTLLWLCGATVLLSPLLRSFAQAHTPPWMTERALVPAVGVPFQLDSLLLGGLLALLWRGEYREQLQSVAKVALALLMTGLLVYMLHERLLHPRNFRHTYVYPAGRFTWGLSLLNLFGATVLVCALRSGSLTYRILNLRPLRWLGRISYGAYVLHDIPHPLYFGVVERLLRYLHQGPHFTQLLVAALGFVCTITVAGLSYRFFETPFLNLKERWAPSNRFQPATAPTSR